MITTLDDRLGDAVMTLADGRRLAWREAGDPRGAPVLALHGLPGSRLKFDTASGHAKDLGLRLISPDRWGYGETDAHRAPTLRAFAADMAALADHLGIETFSVLGVSGGGPYAAALAACLPERVVATALVAPVGPLFGQAGLAIDPFHRFSFGPFARSRRFKHATFRAFRVVMLSMPRAAMAIAMARVPAVDRAVLRSHGVGERLSRTFVEGLRRGPHGPIIDMQLFGRDWDIPFADARGQARIWLGGKDRHVPISAAGRLATLLPNCDVHSMPDEGHLWIALNYAEVLTWIAGQQKGAATATPSQPDDR